MIQRQPKQNKETVISMTKTYIPLTTPEELKALIDAIEQLKAKVGIRKNIRDYGIQEEEFLASLDEMVEQAFDEQCTGANPRYPLFSEIRQMYLNAYYGKHFVELPTPSEKDLPVKDTTDAMKAVYSKGRKA